MMSSSGRHKVGGESTRQDELMKGGEYHPLFGMLSIVESFCQSRVRWLLG